MTFTKTRIAPTPSGFLHLGNVMSFLITADLAKGAKILLRIDDLDRDRVEKEYVEDIFETLDFFGIDYDEGPRNYDEFENKWSQLHRLHLYNAALEKLRPHVYACTCSRTQLVEDNPCRYKDLPLDTPNASWRVRNKDFIVRKKDGFPAYQLSSVVDDLHFGIDLIVRGQDLWDSTQAQLYLAGLLEEPAFTNIQFFHHPLLEVVPGQKLSKSAGDTSIQYLRKQGMSKDEILALISTFTKT